MAPTVSRIVAQLSSFVSRPAARRGVAGIVAATLAGTAVWAAPRPPTSRARRAPVEIGARSRAVAVFDYVEVTVRSNEPVPGNPFTDAQLTGTLTDPDGVERSVLGFCDSEDGRLFRIRFLPLRDGRHRYRLRFEVSGRGPAQESSGSFLARPSARKGLVEVDPDYPFHFRWSGTREPYFYSGATAYHLLSWTDDRRMLAFARRIADAGANRIRFLLYGRASDDEWSEGMRQSDAFVWTLSPWPASFPSRQLVEGSIEPDWTRFRLAHWRKAERLIGALRELGVVAAVSFYIDRGITAEFGPNDAPAAGSAQEELYFRYAVARLAAFANVTWDLGTEHDEYRTAEWADRTGALLQAIDPYRHLVSAHPFRFRPGYLARPWYDFAEHQYYGVEADEFGRDVLERVNGHVRHWRDRTASDGRPIPQVNEEYGYELDPSGFDEPIPQVRRKAWAIAMGGGYVSSGEHKAWQHGDPTNGGQVPAVTRILGDTARMRRFFETRAIPFRELEPMAELDGSGTFGLSLPGSHYVVYLPEGGAVSLDLSAGSYRAEWFNPRSGAAAPIGVVGGGAWRSPDAPSTGAGDDADAVLYLRRIR